MNIFNLANALSKSLKKGHTLPEPTKENVKPDQPCVRLSMLETPVLSSIDGNVYTRHQPDSIICRTPNQVKGIKHDLASKSEAQHKGNRKIMKEVLRNKRNQEESFYIATPTMAGSGSPPPRSSRTLPTTAVGYPRLIISLTTPLAFSRKLSKARYARVMAS